MEREAVVDKYRSLRHELQALGDKISELEMDADEHQLVIAALEPLPPTRKCWRRVGGVLVEGDVASVLPILKTNIQGIEKAMESLKETYKKQEIQVMELEQSLSTVTK